MTTPLTAESKDFLAFLIEADLDTTREFLVAQLAAIEAAAAERALFEYRHDAGDPGCQCNGCAAEFWKNEAINRQAAAAERAVAPLLEAIQKDIAGCLACIDTDAQVAWDEDRGYCARHELIGPLARHAAAEGGGE